MTITRAFATLVGCTLLLAVIGGGIGYALGRFVPAYYRSVFEDGHDPRFDPVSVGLGQGLTQGTAGGVVAGLAVIALLSWREIRLARHCPPGPAPVAAGGGSGRAAGRVLRIVGTLLALIFCSAAGLLLGLLAGEQGAYHRRYLEERDALAPALAGDPSFSTLEFDELSRGGATLVGEVPSVADLNRLRGVVVRAVGEARVEEMLGGVDVRE